MVATETTGTTTLRYDVEGRSVLLPRGLAEIEAWLAERMARGQDRRDEVWEGIYVVVPDPATVHGWVQSQVVVRCMAEAVPLALWVAPGGNVGQKADFRIPDVTVFDPAEASDDGVWLVTAKVAVEIRSPDESHEEKLPFYAAHGVNEVVLVGPKLRSVRWLRLNAEGAYESVDRSDVLGLDVTAFAAGLQWE